VLKLGVCELELVDRDSRHSVNRRKIAVTLIDLKRPIFACPWYESHGVTSRPLVTSQQYSSNGRPCKMQQWLQNAVALPPLVTSWLSL